MWYLTNKKTGHVYYLIAQPAGHTVGRVNTDLVIQNDDSISRQHALVQPDKDVLKLTDTGSRYGTYVNGNIAKIVRISKDQPTELAAGDTVQFGRCGSLWTVGRVNFRCLTSTLAMSNELKVVLQKLRAELLPTYAVGLSHLIMPKITVTTKLLVCLVGQVPVVNPEYFAAVDACIAQGNALPPVTDFIPTCTESYIKNDPTMFQPNPARRDLFKGKEFIFFNTAQCQQYEDIVKLAGGVCLCVQREKITKTRFVKPNVVTIKLKEFAASQSQSQSLDFLDKQFTARNLRMIPEVEIGLAVLYASTERYCNPAYNFAFNVEVCAEPEPIATEDILAKNSMNSEDTNPRKKIRMEMNTIPETEPSTERSERVPAQKKAAKNEQPPAPAPRRSKRFPDKQDQGNEKDSYQEPKRPRRASAVSPNRKSSTASKPSAASKSDTPLVPETDTIPESAPQADSAPQAGPSQLFSSARFQAVIQNPEVSIARTTATNKSRAESRRRANVLLQAQDDDDLFNFEGIVPKRKPKTACPSVTNVLPTDSEKTSNEDADDLFSLDENLPSQRRRGTNRRVPNARPLATAAPAECNNRNSKDTPDPQNSGSSNHSLSARFREFMKPIEKSTAAWMSSTMCALKLKSTDDDQSPSVKVKQEPLDSVDGMADEDNRWIAEMSNIFQVQEKSVNLVAHLPPSRETAVGHERSCTWPDGVRNFKAFVKIRNYQAPQTSVGRNAMKVVSTVDESQAE
uniref:FHA domain-containing protein n=1 Tax=Anopheles atroparvus TaxID=41427 RepID=A0AAG5CZ54_ANOAO